MKSLNIFTLIGVLILAGCMSIQVQVNEPEMTINESTPMEQSNNPFLQRVEFYDNYPRFDLIEPQHYAEAFAVGMREHLEEIDAIANQEATPTIDNTLIAMERSGRLLDRVTRVFYAMSSTNTNDDIDAIEVQIAPELASHQDEISLNENLFNRIQSLYNERASLSLDAETLRLLEETYDGFIRSGAGLGEADKSRLREINQELASLQTQFDQNVLDERNRQTIFINDASELAGLTQGQIERAAQDAESMGHPGEYAIPLLNTSSQPYLSVLESRELRQRIMNASLSRGLAGDFANAEIIVGIVRLRSERAQLLGYPNHASYVLSNQTAQNENAVIERLRGLSASASRNALAEAEQLQSLIDSQGGNFELESWDWPFYSQQLRQQLYSFDESDLMPYLEMNNVLENGVFFAANLAFGISFSERHDLPIYQEDVRVFDVTDADGTQLGLFVFDPYARSNKRGGAWMNSYASQSKLLGTSPIVANHQNITKPSGGEATLLTFDEVTTMFHEFGHALHGLFSNVFYPSLSGTSVPRDFVEYPSQVNELWSVWPEVLANYAVHYQTGEPIPRDLLNRVIESEQFNQGYATSEYLGASVIDMELHRLAYDDIPTAEGLMDFEESVLEDYGLNLSMVPPRYRFPYFSHIMGGYSAGYYSYIWSEVLDADTVAYFYEEPSEARDRGQALRDGVLSRGNSQNVMELYRNFRGRDAEVRFLLERRGLN